MHLKCHFDTIAHVLPLFLFSTHLFTSTLANDPDYSVPSGWLDLTSDLTRADRAKLAGDAISAMLPYLDPATGTVNTYDSQQSSSVFAVLAKQDFFNNNTNNKNTVEINFQRYENAFPQFYATHSNAPQRANSDNTFFGVAAFYCYRAYRNPFFLSIATSVWDQTTKYVLTEQDAKDGSHPLRSVTIQSQCQNASTAGAVFWAADDQDDTAVNGETLGCYMILSAYLFEETKDSKYYDAATLTGTFIQNQLFNGTVVFDTINLLDCGMLVGIFSYNVGLWIEALAVLANITEDIEWTSLLNNLVVLTIRSPVFVNSLGIAYEEGSNENEGRSGSKALFIRALHETWSRSDKNSPVATLIESFLTVQMNAVLIFARTGSTNYTTDWVGPPHKGSKFYPEGNLAATDALNAAFDIVPGPPSPTSTNGNTTLSGNGNGPTAPAGPSGPSSSKPSTSTPPASHAGVIAGSVIGSLAGLLVLIGSTLFIRHRHRAAHAGSSMRDMANNNFPSIIEPFPVDAIPTQFRAPLAQVGSRHEKYQLQEARQEARPESDATVRVGALSTHNSLPVPNPSPDAAAQFTGSWSIRTPPDEAPPEYES